MSDDLIGMGDCGDVPWCFWESEYWHFKPRYVLGSVGTVPNKPSVAWP